MELQHIIAFLESAFLPFLVLHVVGASVGMGGVTVTDILFFRFLDDRRITQKEEEVMTTLGHVILTATAVLVLSGIALYVPSAERLNASDPFLFKMTVSAVLVCNGLLLHAFITPRLITIGKLEGGRAKIRQQRHWHHAAFAMGAVSMVSWYTVFLTASFKVHMDFGYATFVAVYGAVLAVAVGVSQIVVVRFLREARV